MRIEEKVTGAPYQNELEDVDDEEFDILQLFDDNIMMLLKSLI